MKMTSERWARICVWLAIAVMLIVGRYTYQDYGLTVDEDVERKSAIISYQYAFERLTGKELNVLDIELHEWKDRYYGVTLQMPMVAVEHLTGFTMPLRDGFMLRHLYTFGLCMLGWICFYCFCSRVFQNRWLGLMGMLMVALYPRFWGEQFTNIKDMVFTATCCACLWTTALCIEHEGKWRFDVLGALASALCANTRFVGFLFPAFLFGYRIVRDWLLESGARGQAGRWWKKTFTRYAVHVLLVLAFYVLITPASWSDPFGFLLAVFTRFSNYGWVGDVPFMGQIYLGSELPAHYLLTWVGISTPLWYLLLMTVGIAAAIIALKKKRFRLWLVGDFRYFVLCFVIAAIPLATPFLKEITLYNSWRHAYYIFPALVVLALFGFRALWHIAGRKKAARIVMIMTITILQALQAGWIAYNHPYEKVYFNPVGRMVAEQVDRDYWYESMHEQLRLILQYDDTHRITVSSDGMIGYTVYDFMPPEEGKRFYVQYGSIETVDYYIDGANTPVPEHFEGFTPVYEVRMKDGLVLSTIHMRTDLLQERFGGVYPAYNLE